jgi:phosphoribosyl 1,2-cyclic phosphodiesterase
LRCFGVGEGWPCGDRRHSSFLYQFGNTSLLVDCGDGLSSNYKAAGLSYDLVEHVLLSHMHSDHVGGFSLFIQGSWLEQRRKAMTVHCPGGAVPPLKAWLDATVLPEELLGFPLFWEPLAATVKIRTAGVTITPFPTSHLESLRKAFQVKHPGMCFDAFSFLLEGQGKRIAHTADIGAVDDLEPLLVRPLDLLVCELSHVDAEPLFEALRGRAIRQVVFIHLAREYWENADATRDMMREELGDIPFVIAKDGDTFTV